MVSQESDRIKRRQLCVYLLTFGARLPLLGWLMRISEIFYSIQGESTYAGKPCVFVRLAGCDLRCTWCDTAYAFNEGQKMSVDAVLQEVERYTFWAPGQAPSYFVGYRRLMELRTDVERAQFQQLILDGIKGKLTSITALPMNFVALCTTIEAPCSTGRQRMGLANVLSTTQRMPRSRALALSVARYCSICGLRAL